MTNWAGSIEGYTLKAGNVVNGYHYASAVVAISHDKCEFDIPIGHSPLALESILKVVVNHETACNGKPQPKFATKFNPDQCRCVPELGNCTHNKRELSDPY